MQSGALEESGWLFMPPSSDALVVLISNRPKHPNLNLATLNLNRLRTSARTYLL